jgi:hypothetical protein
MDKLLHALKFLKMGISVIPLRHRSKEPELRTWEKYKPNNSTTEYGSVGVLPSESDLIYWFGSGWLNYGVLAGWQDLAFLDFDDFDTFALWKSYMELMRLPMPYVVLSSRGAHAYISTPARGSNQKRRGVDVKFHGYVVGPGSTHPNGTQYVAVSELRIMPVDNLDVVLPTELFPLVVPVACGHMEPVQIVASHTEYDAFTLASGCGADLISKVKAAVRIESFFPTARRTSGDGRWWAALCPFHEDKNPSLWIDVKRQICGCNACGFKPMDVLNLYAKMHNISESVAVVEMAREVGVWA